MTSTGPFKQTLSDSNNNYLKIIIIIIIMCYLQTNRKDLQSLKDKKLLKGAFCDSLKMQFFKVIEHMNLAMKLPNLGHIFF